MSCLAISLQPANGPDILLQTREWFPPSRALVALSCFRQTRISFSSSSKLQSTDDGDSSLGDDPLAASSGQLIVGIESRYRVVYRLVNGIYVLGITTVDYDDDHTLNNLFQCISTVNQAVSVVLAACRGVDVTPEKLSKKYAEVYLALDIVLRGVSSIRLSAMLASMHGDGIAKMVSSAVDSENKIRGAEGWDSVEFLSLIRQSASESFRNTYFELSAETLAAGDEFAASTMAVVVHGGGEAVQDEQKVEETTEEKDPFAASDAVSKGDELVALFTKNRENLGTDLTVALAGLEVATLPPAEATRSTFIGVEGFEGDYGGIEFSKEETSLSETFEGFHDAFGGGLDASEFVAPKKVEKSEGLGGLELLETGGVPGDVKVVTAPLPPGLPTTPLENLLVKKIEMKGPEIYISEVVNVEFRESLLARVGLMGVIYLKTLPPKPSDDRDTEFSFRVDGTDGVKRFVMKGSCVSSLGNGIFHVRTKSCDSPLPILKYSLLPRLVPVPLRVRMVKRHSGTLLSVMIQYASNTDLPTPLSDVTFVLKLPVDPALLKVSPKAVLNRSERELRWHVSEIPLKGPPGRLRARMPLDFSRQDDEDEVEVAGHVTFCIRGARSLSGVSLLCPSEGKSDFYEMDHKYESGIYMCN